MTGAGDEVPPGPRASLAASVAARPLHTLLAAVVAGLLTGPRWPVVVLVLATVASAAAAVAGRRSSEDDPAARAPALAPLAAGAAIAVLLGAVVAEARLAALDRTALLPGEGVEVRGWIVEAPRVRAFGARVAPVELRAGPGARERVVVRAPSRVRWPRAAVGDEVVARGRLRALREWEGFERRRNVHAVLEADRVAVTGVRRNGVLDRIRRRAEAAVASGLRPEQAALARGMVLGQDEALPEDLRDALRASGLAHLVAASGQNVMLLAALVLAAATLAGVTIRWRLALALAAVALSVPLAGAGPSIQRAGVMGAAGLVAALAGRRSSRWYALLLAALATLLHNPRAAEDSGWQLSFAAVVAILLLHGRLVPALRARGVPAVIAEAAALTIAATAGTAPLLALHFGQLSLVSLPANLLAVPAVAPVMWLGAIAGILGGAAAAVCTTISAFPLAYLAWLGRTAADVPYASVPLQLPGPAATVAAYAALAAGIIGWPPRREGKAAAVAAALRRSPLGGAFARGVAAVPPSARAHVAAAVLGLAIAAPAVVVARGFGGPGPPAGFRVSFLDVGQGDATLLQHGRHAVLVDTGPPGAPILKELRASGVERLDALFITHRSADHDGNARAVLEAFRVDVLLDGSGEIAAPRGVQRVDPRAGQVLRAGPLRLAFAWPPPDTERSRDDPNETATVTVVTDGPHTVLLPADAESPVTLPLDLPDVDVLKVAHHGSEDPMLPALLDAVDPEIAVVPTGPNTYGHPRPATMATLRAVPEVRRTDRHGTVRIVPGEGGRLVVE